MAYLSGLSPCFKGGTAVLRRGTAMALAHLLPNLSASCLNISAVSSKRLTNSCEANYHWPTFRQYFHFLRCEKPSLKHVTCNLHQSFTLVVHSIMGLSINCSDFFTSCIVGCTPLNPIDCFMMEFLTSSLQGIYPRFLISLIQTYSRALPANYPKTFMNINHHINHHIH